MMVMSKPTRRTFPVTVTRLKMVRCTVCGRSVAQTGSAAGEVLTEHYRREHPELLGDGRD
jgi:hypothetical protein